jgi:hypothetical protein
MKQDIKRVHDKCASRAAISSGLQEENVAEQARAYFAELDAMYADLIKKMMAINYAGDESLKHFFEN